LGLKPAEKVGDNPNPYPNGDTWIVGWINAAPYLASALM
jgi:hypothetical protein